MSMMRECHAEAEFRVGPRHALPRLVLRRLFARILAIIVAADARHRDAVHLGQLDARMLLDIGVSAGDIARERARLVGWRSRIIFGDLARPGETGRARGGSARAGL